MAVKWGITGEGPACSGGVANDNLCTRRLDIIVSSTGWAWGVAAHRSAGTFPQASPLPASVFVESLTDLAQVALQTRILEDEVGDLLDGMQGSGVIATPEGVPDHRQG